MNLSLTSSKVAVDAVEAADDPTAKGLIPIPGGSPANSGLSTEGAIANIAMLGMSPEASNDHNLESQPKVSTNVSRGRKGRERCVSAASEFKRGTRVGTMMCAR